VAADLSERGERELKYLEGGGDGKNVVSDIDIGRKGSDNTFIGLLRSISCITFVVLSEGTTFTVYTVSRVTDLCCDCAQF
jgi:hypothetical protein